MIFFVEIFVVLTSVWINYLFLQANFMFDL